MTVSICLHSTFPKDTKCQNTQLILGFTVLVGIARIFVMLESTNIDIDAKYKQSGGN